MKNKLISVFSVLLLLFTPYLLADSKSDDFYNQLKKHCGKTYYGKTVFPDDPGHDFAGKELKMNIKDCSETEIRIPFQVGEDTSRTWVITKTEKGLLLKHDHRHKDGTPDEITQYGGYANDKGSQFEQHFVADEFTAKLIPAAKTNVWTMKLDLEKKQFIYALQRHSKPRYKAKFSLSSRP